MGTARKYLRLISGRQVRMVETGNRPLTGTDPSELVFFLVEAGVFPPDTPLRDPPDGEGEPGAPEDS